MTPGATVRVATASDGALLAEIERSSPLVFADNSQVAIDRGSDYYAASRLMGGATVLIAEAEGTPAGVICGAVHPVVLGGVERQLLYVHHARILPAFQNQGIGRLLSTSLFEHHREPGFDSAYWYISRANVRSQAFARNAPNRWSFGPEWVSLDCAANAGPAQGRPATPADAGQIVNILNACHAGEEMFRPYTVASLTERLERDPAQYSWGDVLVADGAVAGVWQEGRYIAATFTDAEGQTNESPGAAVLDYGFLAGAGGEMRALLKAWCSFLVERGMTGLSVFTSAGSRSRPLFEGMTGEVSEFDFWTPAIPEPEGAGSRGLYVDHIYF